MQRDSMSAMDPEARPRRLRRYAAIALLVIIAVLFLALIVWGSVEWAAEHQGQI